MTDEAVTKDVISDAGFTGPVNNVDPEDQLRRKLEQGKTTTVENDPPDNGRAREIPKEGVPVGRTQEIEQEVLGGKGHAKANERATASAPEKR